MLVEFKVVKTFFEGSLRNSVQCQHCRVSLPIGSQLKDGVVTPNTKITRHLQVPTDLFCCKLNPYCDLRMEEASA